MSEKPTLETNLKDLESMLDDAILRGLESHSHEDIQEKFTCIGNLVSADPTQAQEHLHKLESLRKSFNERDTSFTIFSNPLFEKDCISNSCRNDNEGGREEKKGMVKEKDSCLKVKSGIGKNCCVLGIGIGIGMILMGFIMVNTSGCFQYVEQTNFAIPT